MSQLGLMRDVCRHAKRVAVRRVSHLGLMRDVCRHAVRVVLRRKPPVALI